MSSSPVLSLIVDTTIQGVSLALTVLGDPKAKDAGILWRGEHLDNAGSVQAISELLERGLKEVDAEPGDLGAVTVSAGPGSFTGIKVGLAFVHGLRLAFAEPLPVLALSSLEEAAAVLARQRAADLCLLLPATRTHGYMAGVVGGKAEPARLVAFEGDSGPDLPASALLCAFGAWPAAAAFCRKPLENLAPSAVCGAAIYGMSVRSTALWPHAFGAAAPDPRYLRLSTAEEKLASSQKG